MTRVKATEIGVPRLASQPTRNQREVCSIYPKGFELTGSSLFRVGDGDREFADGEVDHRDVVAC